MSYPQVHGYLAGQIYATASTKSEISPIESEDSSLISATVLHKSEKGAMASHQFSTPAEVLISHLSFAHIRQLLTVDDPPALPTPAE